MYRKQSLILAVCLNVVTFHAAAQTAPDTGRLIQDQERPRTLEAMPRVPLPELEEPARAARQAQDAVKVRVDAFRISGNTLFSEADLFEPLVDLTGRELDMAGLDEAAARITRYYRQRGYFLASAYLPAQNIRDNVVEIAVLEGRLGKLQLANQSPVKEASVQALLGDVREGRPLHGDDLERSLLLINALRGAEAQATLKPGASVGTTDLDIRVSGQNRLGGNVTLDDFGNRYSGAWRFGSQLNVNSPLALGDALSVRANASDGQFGYGRLAYQLPVGGRGLQVGGAWSSMAYRLGESFAALQAHGTAEIGSVYALYPLRRSRIDSLTLQANLDHKRLEDRTDSTDVRSDKTVNVLSLGISGDRLDGFAGGGATTWNISYSGGRLSLDSFTSALDAAGHRTGGSYDKWSFMAARQQRVPALGEPWSLLAQLSGQLGGKNLDSSEKFALGGAQGVRAYPQGEAACDDAWLASVELHYAPTRAWRFYALYDTASGWLNHAPIAADARNHQSVSGAGVGAGFNPSNDLSVSLVLAWRTSEQPRSDRDRAPRLWFMLQKNF